MKEIFFKEVTKGLECYDKNDSTQREVSKFKSDIIETFDLILMNLLETVDSTDLTTIQVLMNYLWNINSGDMIFNETETDAIYLL